MKRLEDYTTEMDAVVEEARESGGDGSIVYYGIVLACVLALGVLTRSSARRRTNGSRLQDDRPAFVTFLPFCGGAPKGADAMTSTLELNIRARAASQAVNRVKKFHGVTLSRTWKRT